MTTRLVTPETLAAAVDEGWLRSGDAHGQQRPPDLAGHVWAALPPDPRLAALLAAVEVVTTKEGPVHGVAPDEPDALNDDIDAIEAEAVAAERARIVAAVAALERTSSQYDWSDPPRLLHEDVDRAAVLRIISGEPDA